eukprot:TRINITY_DN11680_c0_g1_i2.p1 TRINITY_DN11680_c0_g1~~TRINITY_DN11680_c0_g1_i2.p1  ORF type:complete len:965 (+),score=313.73 TRINITY_DN11680_c0_g1_i2:93-2987(+)
MHRSGAAAVQDRPRGAAGGGAGGAPYAQYYAAAGEDRDSSDGGEGGFYDDGYYTLADDEPPQGYETPDEPQEAQPQQPPPRRDPLYHTDRHRRALDRVEEGAEEEEEEEDEEEAGEEEGEYEEAGRRMGAQFAEDGGGRDAHGGRAEEGEECEEEEDEDEVAALVEENHELRALVEQQERERSELIRDRDELRRSLTQKLHDQSAASERQLGELAATLEDLRAEQQEHQGRAAEEEEARAAAEAQVAGLAAQLDEAEAARRDLELRLQASEEDARRLQRMLDAARTEAAETAARRHASGSPAAPGAKRGLQQRAEEAERRARDLELQLEAARAEAAEAACRRPASGSPAVGGATPRRGGLLQRAEEAEQRAQDLERALGDELQLRRAAERDALKARSELAEREMQWECRTERSATPARDDILPVAQRRAPGQRPSTGSPRGDPVLTQELGDMSNSELSKAEAAFAARIAHLSAQHRDMLRQLHRNDPERFADPDAEPPQAEAAAAEAEQGDCESPERGADTEIADPLAGLDAEWAAFAHWLRGRYGAQTSLKELKRHFDGFAPRRMRTQSPAASRCARTASSRLGSPAPLRPRGGASVCGESSLGYCLDEAPSLSWAATPRAALFGPPHPAGPPPAAPAAGEPSPQQRDASPASQAQRAPSLPSDRAAHRGGPAESAELDSPPQAPPSGPYQQAPRAAPPAPAAALRADALGRGERAAAAAAEAGAPPREYSESMRDAARERGRRAYIEQKEQRQQALRQRLAELREPVVASPADSARATPQQQGPRDGEGGTELAQAVAAARELWPREALEARQDGGGDAAGRRPHAGQHRAPPHRHAQQLQQHAGPPHADGERWTRGGRRDPGGDWPAAQNGGGGAGRFAQHGAAQRIPDRSPEHHAAAAVPSAFRAVADSAAHGDPTAQCLGGGARRALLSGAVQHPASDRRWAGGTPLWRQHHGGSRPPP